MIKRIIAILVLLAFSANNILFALQPDGTETVAHTLSPLSRFAPAIGTEEHDDFVFRYFFDLMKAVFEYGDPVDMTEGCLKRVIEGHFSRYASMEKSGQKLFTSEMFSRYDWGNLYKKDDAFYIPYLDEKGRLKTWLRYYISKTKPEVLPYITSMEIKTKQGRCWFVCEPDDEIEAIVRDYEIEYKEPGHGRKEVLDKNCYGISNDIRNKVQGLDGLSEGRRKAIYTMLDHIVDNAVDSVFQKIDTEGSDALSRNRINFQVLYSEEDNAYHFVVKDEGKGIGAEVLSSWIDGIFKSTKDPESSLTKGGVGAGMESILGIAYTYGFSVSFMTRTSENNGYRFVQENDNIRTISQLDVDEVGTTVTVTVPAGRNNAIDKPSERSRRTTPGNLGSGAMNIDEPIGDTGTSDLDSDREFIRQVLHEYPEIFDDVIENIFGGDKKPGNIVSFEIKDIFSGGYKNVYLVKVTCNDGNNFDFVIKAVKAEVADSGTGLPYDDKLVKEMEAIGELINSSRVIYHPIVGNTYKVFDERTKKERHIFTEEYAYMSEDEAGPNLGIYKVVGYLRLWSLFKRRLFVVDPKPMNASVARKGDKLIPVLFDLDGMHRTDYDITPLGLIQELLANEFSEEEVAAALCLAWDEKTLRDFKAELEKQLEQEPFAMEGMEYMLYVLDERAKNSDNFTDDNLVSGVSELDLSAIVPQEGEYMPETILSGPVAVFGDDTLSIIEEMVRKKREALVHSDEERPIIIWVDGDEGSGKSYFTVWLQNQLGFETISIDKYIDRDSNDHGINASDFENAIKFLTNTTRARAIVVEGREVLNMAKASKLPLDIKILLKPNEETRRANIVHKFEKHRSEPYSEEDIQKKLTKKTGYFLEMPEYDLIIDNSLGNRPVSKILAKHMVKRRTAGGANRSVRNGPQLASCINFDDVFKAPIKSLISYLTPIFAWFCIRFFDLSNRNMSMFINVALHRHKIFAMNTWRYIERHWDDTEIMHPHEREMYILFAFKSMVPAVRLAAWSFLNKNWNNFRDISRRRIIGLMEQPSSRLIEDALMAPATSSEALRFFKEHLEYFSFSLKNRVLESALLSSEEGISGAALVTPFGETPASENESFPAATIGTRSGIENRASEPVDAEGVTASINSRDGSQHELKPVPPAYPKVSLEGKLESNKPGTGLSSDSEPSRKDPEKVENSTSEPVDAEGVTASVPVPSEQAIADTAQEVTAKVPPTRLTEAGSRPEINQEGGRNVPSEDASELGDMDEARVCELLKKYYPARLEEIEDAVKLASAMLKYPIDRVMCVGKGLRFLPFIFALLGKETFYVTRLPDEAIYMNSWFTEELKIMGRKDAAIRVINSEIGALSLERQNIIPNSFDAITFVDLLGGYPIGKTRQWLLKAKELLKEESLIVIDEQADSRDPMISHFSHIFPNHEALENSVVFRGSYQLSQSANRLYRIFSEADTEKIFIEHSMGEDDKVYLRAKDRSGKMVGSVAYSVTQENVIQLLSINVPEAQQRGRGIGERLMRMLKEEAVNQGIPEIFVVCLKNNAMGVRFYESMGKRLGMYTIKKATEFRNQPPEAWIITYTIPEVNMLADSKTKNRASEPVDAEGVTLKVPPTRLTEAGSRPEINQEGGRNVPYVKKGFAMYRPINSPVNFKELPLREDYSIKISENAKYCVFLCSCVGLVVFNRDGLPVGLAHFLSGTPKIDVRTIINIYNQLNADHSFPIVNGTVGIDTYQKLFIEALKQYLKDRGIPEEQIHVHESDYYKDILDQSVNTWVMVTPKGIEDVRLDYCDDRSGKVQSKAEVLKSIASLSADELEEVGSRPEINQEGGRNVPSEVSRGVQINAIQKAAQDIIDAVNAEAILLSIANEKKTKIIALETSWIPEDQIGRTGITGLLDALEDLPRKMHLDNLKIFCARGKGLENKIQRAMDDKKEEAVRLEEADPEFDITITGREEDILAMKKVFTDAVLAKLNLGKFDPKGDVRVEKIITGLLSYNPNNGETIIDEYLKIGPDPNNQDGCIVYLKAEPINMDADRDRYLLLTREIDTRA